MNRKIFSQKQKRHKKIYLTIPLSIGGSHNYISEIRKINSINKEICEIKSIYGSFPDNMFGSGRPHDLLGKITESGFTRIVKEIQRQGIEFHYALNAPSFHGYEGGKAFKEKLTKYLNFLSSLGVNDLILSNPYLIYYVPKIFPNFKITISSFLVLDSLTNINIFKNFRNVKYLVLPPQKNHDFSFIKKAVQELNKLKQDLIIMSDHTCGVNCPLYHYHASLCGYSIPGKKMGELFKFVYAFCKYQKSLPAFKSSCLPPHLVKKYVLSGVKIFKIQGRQLSSDILLENINTFITDYKK